MNDLSYLEALQQRRTEIDLACQETTESLNALWDHGEVIDAEFFTLVEMQDDLEKLQTEKAEVLALYLQARDKAQALEHKEDQSREDPAK